ncbi:MAG: hypothetical protein AB1894_01020 [Chloroflexota bacterium]
MKSIKQFLYRASRSSMAARLTGKGISTLVILAILLTVVTPAAKGAAPQQATKAPAAPPVWDTPIIVDAPALFYEMTDRSMRYRRLDKPSGDKPDPCVAYGGDHLYFSCYDSDLEVWDTEIVDPSNMVGSHAALDFNSNDAPFISYFDGLNGRLKLAYNLGFGWVIRVVDVPILMLQAGPTEEAPVVDVQDLQQQFNKVPWRSDLLASPDLDPTSSLLTYNPGKVGVGKYSSIAIDANNQIHISYHDEQNGALRYAFSNDGVTFNIEVVHDYHDQGDTGLWTSIKVYEHDPVAPHQPNIAYMDEKYDNVMYVKKKSGYLGGWSTPILVDGVSNVGPCASLAVTSFSNGTAKPHISYMDFATYSLKYAVMNSDLKTFTKTVVDSVGHVGQYTSIAKDDDGRMYISYYDLGNGNLKVAYQVSGGGWSKSVVASAGDVGLFTSIDTRQGGYPGVSFFDASEGTLRFARWNGTGWTGLPTVAYSGDVGLSTSLALAFDGTPHISYMNDTGDDLKYAHAVGWNWYKEVIPTIDEDEDPVDAGAYSSIELLWDSIPIIAYYDMTHEDVSLATWLWWFWYVEFVDDSDDDVGKHVSMELDSLGFPRMTYYDDSNNDLMYTWWKDLTDEWWIERIDYEFGDKGKFTSLALNAFDKPYISYYEDTNEWIKLAYLSPIDAWVKMHIDSVGDPDDDFPVVEAYTSIDMDSLDNPHIAYYNETNGDLMYAYFNGVAWVVEPPVDSVGDVGKYASLAINPVTDERHICYYDATNDDLKYAYWDGGWSTFTLDAVGDVGMFCSIDLDGLGRPAISYYDASMGDLKFIASYTLPLASIFIPIVFEP